MSSLLSRIRRGLKAVADSDRAAGAQAYMKSEMPFHGVDTTSLREVCKAVFRDHPIESPESWREDILDLWRGAKFREERYAAIELAGDKRAGAFQRMDALPMYEEMIVTGAWWDLVDALASHRLGEILRNDPKAMRRTMLAWRSDPDMWKRRSSIICQLTFKKDTDLELLYACIEPSLSSKDFFLRKAIGWALRQYAWTNPEEVVRYVGEHESELSGLSKREALKNVTVKR